MPETPQDDLPVLVAPPLVPGLTLDIDVALTHDVEWLGED